MRSSIFKLDLNSHTYFCSVKPSGFGLGFESSATRLEATAFIAAGLTSHTPDSRSITYIGLKVMVCNFNIGLVLRQKNLVCQGPTRNNWPR